MLIDKLLIGNIIKIMINNLLYNNFNMNWKRLWEWLDKEWLKPEKEFSVLFTMDIEFLKKETLYRIHEIEPSLYEKEPSLLNQVCDLFSRIKYLELLLNTLDTSDKLFSLRELVKLHKELISLLSWSDDRFKVLENQIPWLNTKLDQYERMLEELEALDKKIKELKNIFKDLHGYIWNNQSKYLNIEFIDEVLDRIDKTLFNYRWYEKYLVEEMFTLYRHRSNLEELRNM